MYAFLVAFGVTAVIALFWITSLPARFAPTPAVVHESAPHGNIVDEISEYVFTLQKDIRHFFAAMQSGEDTTTYVSSSTSSAATDTPTFMDLNAMVASSSAATHTVNALPKADTTSAEKTNVPQ